LRIVTYQVTLTPMIKSFRHKGLAALFEAGSARKVQPKHAKRLNLILTALNAATQAAQMAMPGMRFHPLRGNRYSVWVYENYRVTFRFDAGHAYEVDYEDYH
jgi:toxin HigB-1